MAVNDTQTVFEFIQTKWMPKGLRMWVTQWNSVGDGSGGMHTITIKEPDESLKSRRMYSVKGGYFRNNARAAADVLAGIVWHAKTTLGDVSTFPWATWFALRYPGGASDLAGEAAQFENMGGTAVSLAKLVGSEQPLLTFLRELGETEVWEKFDRFTFTHTAENVNLQRFVGQLWGYVREV